MNLNKQTHIFINKDAKEMFHFYMKETSLYYKKRNRTILQEEIKLVDKIKIYDITLDNKDYIHLICVTEKGELWYFMYANNKWEKIMLKKFPQKVNQMDYIHIVSMNEMVHIFYSFSSLPHNQLLRIVHLHKNGLNWKINYFQSISFMKKEVPYWVDYKTNGDLFFLYKMKKNNKVMLYLHIYVQKDRTWKQMIKIEPFEKNINIKNFFIDSIDNIHFIYTSEELSSVYHTCKNIKDLSKNMKWYNSILMDKEENTIYKFFEKEENLWFIWKKEDEVGYKYSTDYGMNWTEYKRLKKSKVFDIYYVGRMYKEQPILKPFHTLGNIQDEELYLIGMDNNILSEEDREEAIKDNITSESDLHKENDFSEKIIVEEEMYFRSAAENEERKESVLKKITKYFNKK